MSAPLPTVLLSSLQNVPGFDAFAFEAVHASGEQLTSLRRNPRKITEEDFLLRYHHPEKIPWCSNGYYLEERPLFTLDPLLHAGAYYVQEASSMFLEEALKQTCDLSQPLKVLDLCAAPGGKSTLLQSVISDSSLLVSNEVIKTRVNILSENISKWGAPNVVVTNNDPHHFKRLENFFDLIVVDAPCSGSGLFRKDPEAIKEWSINNVQLCSQRQQRILAHILPSLKENGVLIYATCSYSVEEDENILQWITDHFAMDNLQLRLHDEWGITETRAGDNFGYRFYPDKVKGEGFFIAAFRKKITGADTAKIKTAKQKNGISSTDMAILQPFVKDMTPFSFIKQNEAIIALPHHVKDSLPALQTALYIKKAGVRIGTIIRNELLPDHELALSTIIGNDILSIDVNKETALQYLRREEIKTATAVKGWALVRYEGAGLGWIKLLQQRRQ